MHIYSFPVIPFYVHLGGGEKSFLGGGQIFSILCGLRQFCEGGIRFSMGRDTEFVGGTPNICGGAGDTKPKEKSTFFVQLFQYPSASRIFHRFAQNSLGVSPL